MKINHTLSPKSSVFWDTALHSQRFEPQIHQILSPSAGTFNTEVVYIRFRQFITRIWLFYYITEVTTCIADNIHHWQIINSLHLVSYLKQNTEHFSLCFPLIDRTPRSSGYHSCFLFRRSRVHISARKQVKTEVSRDILNSSMQIPG
jgi:hypothetical protein